MEQILAQLVGGAAGGMGGGKVIGAGNMGGLGNLLAGAAGGIGGGQLLGGLMGAGGAAADAAGGGGMGGMPGMADILSDPDLMAAMQNPKVMQAFQGLMAAGGPQALLSNPAKLQELMGDPDVGPVLQKLMSKFTGGAGFPGAAGAATGSADVDEIPDLGDLPDLE